MVEIQTPVLPSEVMPVVEILRRDVPRPISYPLYKGHLRWLDDNYESRCPMGLHPTALLKLPCKTAHFGPGSLQDAGEFAVSAFYNWWDSRTNPKVMDLIWPTPSL